MPRPAFLACASVSALVCALALALACDDQKSEAADQPDAASGGSGANGGAGGQAGSAGARTSGCDTAACEGFKSDGAYATCCLSETTCGVAVGGKCVELEAFTRIDGGGGGFDLSEETIILDPTCPGLSSIMGMPVEMPGCCDASGICGISTENVAKAFGFPIPGACVTRNDQGVGQVFTSALPEVVSCNYAGRPEAGAPD